MARGETAISESGGISACLALSLLFLRKRGHLNFQETVELSHAGRMAHLAQGFGLDLPDALARDPELFADFLESSCAAFAQSDSQFEHLAFPARETRQHLAKLVPHHPVNSTTT